jgi:hypothetical protein
MYIFRPLGLRRIQVLFLTQRS